MLPDPPSHASSSFAAKFRHSIAQDIVDCRAFAARQALFQSCDPGADCFKRWPHRLGGNDAGNADVDCLFLAGKQNFIQPLARTNSGESDFNITVRFQPAEPDYALSQINDLYRLPHIENVNGHVAIQPAQSMTGGRDDQIARLANGHEVTHHIRVSDGDWTAGFDLCLEFRNYGAVGGKHVAEP